MARSGADRPLAGMPSEVAAKRSCTWAAQRSSVAIFCATDMPNAATTSIGDKKAESGCRRAFSPIGCDWVVMVIALVLI